MLLVHAQRRRKIGFPCSIRAACQDRGWLTLGNASIDLETARVFKIKRKDSALAQGLGASWMLRRQIHSLCPSWCQRSIVAIDRHRCLAQKMAGNSISILFSQHWWCIFGRSFAQKDTNQRCFYSQALVFILNLLRPQIPFLNKIGSALRCMLQQWLVVRFRQIVVARLQEKLSWWLQCFWYAQASYKENETSRSSLDIVQGYKHVQVGYRS